MRSISEKEQNTGLAKSSSIVPSKNSEIQIVHKVSTEHWERGTFFQQIIHCWVKMLIYLFQVTTKTWKKKTFYIDLYLEFQFAALISCTLHSPHDALSNYTLWHNNRENTSALNLLVNQQSNRHIQKNYNNNNHILFSTWWLARS